MGNALREICIHHTCLIVCDLFGLVINDSANVMLNILITTNSEVLCWFVTTIAKSQYMNTICK